MNWLSIVLVSLLSISSHAFETYYPYYGIDFYDQIEKIDDGAPLEIRAELYRVLSSYHQESENNGFDTILSRCTSENCYKHTVYSYSQARRFMFGELDLKKDENNRYYVHDVYCDVDVSLSLIHI